MLQLVSFTKPYRVPNLLKYLHAEGYQVGSQTENDECSWTYYFMDGIVFSRKFLSNSQPFFVELLESGLHLINSFYTYSKLTLEFWFYRSFWSWIYWIWNCFDPLYTMILIKIENVGVGENNLELLTENNIFLRPSPDSFISILSSKNMKSNFFGLILR